MNKKQKLEELEYRLKRFDVNKNINVEKLVDILMK